MSREITLAIIKGRCRVNQQTECWEWMNCVQGNGYGRIRYKAQTRYAHRVAYELAKGPIPKGKDVCHECDNRKCCNPDHLFAGTRLVNMRDAMSKGRMSRGIKHSLTVIQHVRARAKLSMDKAREIRKLSSLGARADELAKQFGVDVTNIRMILKNKTWREAHLFPKLQ